MELGRALRGILGRHTVNDLLVVYQKIIETRHYKLHTKQNYNSAMRHISDGLGTRRLSALQPWEIAAWLRSIADSGRANTARTLLWMVRDFLNEGLLLGWIKTNPAMHVKPTRAPVLRQRMTLEQWRAILDAGTRTLPAWWPVGWRLALVTGQRCADVVAMRYDHVRDDMLYIQQQKTGAKVALPLSLRLDAVGLSLRDVIEDSRSYGQTGTHFLRSPKLWRPITAKTFTHRSISARREAGITVDTGTPPSLHEVRSLSERLYRAQGIDTQTLLGHRNQSMTDKYNDVRGLNKDQWKVLRLPP